MKIITSISLLLLLATTASSQDLQAIKSRYPGYDVVVLNHNIHYKIKVVNGQPQATSNETQQLYYVTPKAASYMSQYSFVHSSFHQVQQYEAFTKTADSRKVKVTDFKTRDNTSQGIFYDDVKETSFDFPAIAPGATGTLQTTIFHKDAHLLTPFYFRRRVPVLNSELKISFPSDMSVRYVLLGLDTTGISFSSETRRGETTYSFRGKDLEPETHYADAPDNSYYSAHVVFHIQQFKNEQKQVVRFLSNVDDLYQLNRSFLADINKTVDPALKLLVDSLKKSSSDKTETAQKIYQWVQQHVKYVAFEEGLEGFVPRNANLVFTRRFGDCKDMSSILTVMLNEAGIPAYYTWIGTRSLPYNYAATPTPIVDNHMICTINLDGQYIFLDGTDPTCAFGSVPEAIQAKEALVAIDDKNYKVLKVPTPNKEQNVLVDSTVLTIGKEGLTGKIAIHLSGYYAMDFHGLLQYTSERNREENMQKRFHRGSNKFLLKNYTVGDLNQKDAVTLGATFTLQDYAKKVMDEYYINLNLFKFYEHEQIDFPKRKTPVEFPHHFTRRYVTILEVPEGYKVGYVPEAKAYSNEVWGYKMKYEQQQGKVILTQEFTNDKLLLHPHEFEKWNKVLEHLLPNYNESISLIKK